MNELLEKYELLEYKDVLKENHIHDLKTLQAVIATNLFDNVVPLTHIGPRAKFILMCNENLPSNLPIIEVSSEVSLLIPNTRNDDSNHIPVENSSQAVEIIAVETQNSSELLENQCIIVDDRIPNTPKLKEVADFNLIKLLESHPIGKGILKLPKNKPLSSATQQDLCEIICIHFLTIMPNGNLGFDELDFIAHQIHCVHPAEDRRTYVCPPVKKRNSRSGKSELMKGKLYNKYHNLKAKVNKANNSVTIDSAEGSIITAGGEEASFSKNWLVNHRDETEVLKHWNISYPLRCEDIVSSKEKFDCILKEWPILKESIGSILIDIDFKKKHKITYDEFCTNWNNVFKNILDKFGDNFNDPADISYLNLLSSNNINEDSKNFIKFSLLVKLLPEKGNKVVLKKDSDKSSAKAPKKPRKGKYEYWKPSAIESREGVILIVKSAAEIENQVFLKRQKMIHYKLNLQPFIIIIGDGFYSIDKVYIRIDDISYECDCLLAALYLLNQIYITFNLAYPVESEAVSYFMQWDLLKIKTSSDMQLPTVYAIINKLNNNFN